MASRNPLRSIQNKPGEWNQRRNSTKPRTSNARQSHVPSQNPRNSLAPNTAARLSLASNRRQSSIGGMVNRRQSSIGGRYQGKGNDARKQTEANIRKIIEFLSARNYPGQVSLKLLAQPSVKDFRDITIFLFREIDSGYEWKGPPEDEIPKFFRQLHCPFTLNRSSLKSVGPATWPTVLQALGWLVDLLNYSLADQETRFQSDDDLHQKLFFDFLSITYQRFLQGENSYEALEAELSDFFAERNDKVAESIEETKLQNEQLLAEIKRLQNEKQEIPTLKKKIAEIRQEQVRFEGTVNEWEKHEAQIRERNTRLAEKLAEANGKLEEAQKEQQIVLAKLDKQEMKSEDVQRLYADRSGLQQELQLVMKNHQVLQGQSTELEKQLQTLFDNLQPLLRQYNQIATDMKLIPATAKYANGFEYEISVLPRNLQDESYHIEINKDIRVNIIKLRQTLKYKVAEHDEKRIQLQHLLEQESEKLQDKEEESVGSKQQLEETLRRVEAQKQQIMDEHREYKERVNSLRGRLEELEKTSQNELTEAVQRHQTLEQQYQKEEQAIQEMRDIQITRFQETCTLLMNHKEYLKQRLERMYHTIKQDVYSQE